jgi:hypothetical protein
MKQPRTDAVFQFLNRRRDGRSGNAERVGCTGKARAFDDAGEDAEQVYAIQVVDTPIARIF